MSEWETIHEEGGYKIQVTPDDMVNDPFEDDESNWFHIIYCSHKYKLGTDLWDRNRYNTMEEQMEAKYGPALFTRPVYAYVHSGTALSFSPFSCPWDSGQCGVLYVPKKLVRECYMVKRISQKVRDQVEASLPGQLQLLEDYLAGNVYGFRVVNAEDEDDELDSSWGYFGSDHEASGLLETAKECLPAKPEVQNE